MRLGIYIWEGGESLISKTYVECSLDLNVSGLVRRLKIPSFAAVGVTLFETHGVQGANYCQTFELGFNSKTRTAVQKYKLA